MGTMSPREKLQYVSAGVLLACVGFFALDSFSTQFMPLDTQVVPPNSPLRRTKLEPVAAPARGKSPELEFDTSDIIDKQPNDEETENDWKYDELEEEKEESYGNSAYEEEEEKAATAGEEEQYQEDMEQVKGIDDDFPKQTDHQGPSVLFFPCYVDGFYSNMRQVVASIFLARQYNLTYVAQDIFYRYQDDANSGIQGHDHRIDGPVNVFDFFDRAHMQKFVNVQSQSEFWELDYQPGDESTRLNALKISPEKYAAASAKLGDSLNYVGVDKGMRCEDRLGPTRMKKMMQWWYTLYNLQRQPFLTNDARLRTRWEQLNKLKQISSASGEKFVFAGTPRFTGMTKEYSVLPKMWEKAQVSKYFMESMPAFRFAPRIVKFQQQAKRLLGMEDHQSYVAVHARRGDTNANGGLHGQANEDEVVNAVLRALDCAEQNSGKRPSTVFVSAIGPFLKAEVLNLVLALSKKDKYEKIRVVAIGKKSFGAQSHQVIAWEDLRPGLSAREFSALREHIEMQFWYEADAFCGSRSTMSSFMTVMRASQEEIYPNHNACNRFMQRDWLQRHTGVEVP